METMMGITQRYNGVMALVDDDSVPQEVVDKALMEVMDDVKSKGENGINYLHSIDDNIEAAKKRKKGIDDYLKVLEKRKKRVLHAYLAAMDNMGMKSIMTGAGELKVRKNPPALVIDDISKIPSKFEKLKVEISLDKVAIKNAIKAGEKIEGCHIVQSVSLSY